MIVVTPVGFGKSVNVHCFIFYVYGSPLTWRLGVVVAYVMANMTASKSVPEHCSAVILATGNAMPRRNADLVKRNAHRDVLILGVQSNAVFR